jgi:hypothetical protein
MRRFWRNAGRDDGRPQRCNEGASVDAVGYLDRILETVKVLGVAAVEGQPSARAAAAIIRSTARG